MKHLLNVLSGPEQFEVRHIKDQTQYIPLPKPGVCCWAICSIYKEKLSEEFVDEHLAQVSGTLLLHLATLLVAEANQEQIRVVLASIGGVLTNAGHPEAATVIRSPPVIPCDEFDELVDEDIIFTRNAQLIAAGLKPALKSGGGGGGDKKDEKGKKGNAPALPPSDTPVTLPPVNIWDVASDKPFFDKFIRAVVYVIANDEPDVVPTYLDLCAPMLTSTFPAQRLGATALLVGSLRHLSAHTDLVAKALDSVQARTNDEFTRIKITALEGLGYFPTAHPKGISSMAAPALATACRGCDDKDDLVVRTAVTSARMIVCAEHLDDSAMSPMLLNCCVSARALINKNANIQLRTAGLAFMAALARFGGGFSTAQYIEQLHNAMPLLAVIMADKFVLPRRTVRKLLRTAVPLLKAPTLSDFFESELFEADTDLATGTTCVDEVYEKFVKLWIDLYTPRLGAHVATLTSYLTPQQPNATKISSCQLLGLLLRNIPREDRARIPAEQAVKGVCALLKDPVDLIRTSAARTLSWLWDY